jgi:hypothetical protein
MAVTLARVRVGAPLKLEMVDFFNYTYEGMNGASTRNGMVRA